MKCLLCVRHCKKFCRRDVIIAFHNSRILFEKQNYLLWNHQIIIWEGCKVLWMEQNWSKLWPTKVKGKGETMYWEVLFRQKMRLPIMRACRSSFWNSAINVRPSQQLQISRSLRSNCRFPGGGEPAWASLDQGLSPGSICRGGKVARSSTECLVSFLWTANTFLL